MPKFDPASVKAALQDDAPFKLNLRFLSGDILFRMEVANYLLSIRDGELADFRVVDGSQTADLTFTGPADAWDKVLQVVPPPGCQSVLYNDGRAGIRYEGDPINGTGKLAMIVHEFMRVLKQVVNGTPDCDLLPEADRDFDAAVGRYMYIRVEGIQYRIYFEEAGTGSIPLLLQHTAGSDSRQARHFLEDPELQKHFRMIAYDMPFHGRSLPPMAERWWDQRYCLTKSFLMGMVLAISHKLKLDRPVFLGSAMGGQMALDLAYDHPDEFRAVIGLNAGPPADFDPAMVKRLEAMGDPRIRSFNTAMMLAAMAATTPEINRRELEWVYNQSGPAIGEGALNYFVFDHTLTAEQAATIDTDKCQVFLFTGEDDFYGTEYGTDRFVAGWDSVKYTRLRRLGHFGIAENPEALKGDLWPAFAEIIENSAASAAVPAE